MTLQQFLDLSNLGIRQFRQQLADAGTHVSYHAVRLWVRAERTPGLETMAAIDRVTRGHVQWADWLAVRRSVRRKLNRNRHAA